MTRLELKSKWTMADIRRREREGELQVSQAWSKVVLGGGSFMVLLIFLLQQR